MTRKVKPLIYLEQLEPRILLSGDGLLNITSNMCQDTVLDNPSKVIQEAGLLDTNDHVEEQISLGAVQPVDPEIEAYEPIFTLSADDNANEGSADTDLNVDNIGPVQVISDVVLLLNDSDGDIESLAITDDGSMPVYINDVDLSIEYATSIEIRGPPANETVALFGMHLVEPNVDNFDGQIVYLDFDGEENVAYDGPVTVEGVYVPGFAAPGGLAGQEHAIINEVLGSLGHHFTGSGVIFTTEKPEIGISYSTIYIGGDDSAFTAYGSFLGLAEQIDVGNQDLNDEAFIFSDNLNGSNDNLQIFAANIANVIAHETGHLLGYQHDNEDPNGGVLSVVALDKATNPTPADGSMHPDTWVSLGWTPGDSAVSHDIYMGESFADVDASTGGTFVGNQTQSFFVAGFPGFPYPGGLVLGTTYYWRIDEVNNADPSSPWKGDVWSFTIGGMPEIDVEWGVADDVHAYPFGTVEVGQSFSEEFTVRNEGNIDLVVSQASGLISPFSISPVNDSGSADDWVIPASGTQMFMLSFSPVNPGYYSDTLILESNDLNEGNYQILVTGTGSTLFGSQQVISTQADGAFSVYACDLDGDGDNDVLSASNFDNKIAWYENLGSGTFSSQQVISTQADGAQSIYACDLDGDGDNDVLSASYYDDKIAWYENLGSGTFSSQQVISTQGNGPRSVYASDLDGDGDNDVLSACYDDNMIAWYENLGGGTFGSQQVISTQVIRGWAVYASDLDGDGDNDVLSASVLDNKIAWYENLGGGTFGSQQVISLQAEYARSVYACDLDGDGDNDVLSASYNDDKIAWYENLGAGSFGSQQVISNQASRALSVYACDLDGDGDNDVLSASAYDDKIAWYENLGGGTFGNQQIISTQANFARSVYACDLDGDGDNDVLSASDNDDKIAWYENLRSPGAGAPEIDVEQYGTNDDDVHSYSFGTVQAGQTVSQLFRVRNEGSDALIVTHAAGLDSPFSISPVNSGGTIDDWIVFPGEIYVFSVIFSPVGAGNFNDTLVLTSNDSNEGSYQINFTSSVSGPEIEVIGNSQVILDGDTTPEPSDHTDFGSLSGTGGSITRTFTIRNTGLGDLSLTGSPDRVIITGSGDFTVTQQPASSVVANGGTTTFEVTLDPSSYGMITATISIASDDYNENPYDFVIKGTGVLFGTQQTISTQADGADSVYACDLDGDGDNDVLSASVNDDTIAWYENLGGIFGSEQVIDTQADGANSVYACDLDGDGDNDVLLASYYGDNIAWYENQGGGTFGSRQVITTLTDGARSVYACDLDGDGDNDVLSASAFDDKVAWYENNGSGIFGSQQVISTQADNANSVYACDLDGDGDYDVLSASRYDDSIAWYENLGGGTFGIQQVISTQAEYARSVYACDLDGDGDNDVLSASYNDDKIAWYENLDGDGTFGSQQVISTQADHAFLVYACDLDGDGDNDVLSASIEDDKIAWYENQGGGTFGSQQVISTQAEGARGVYACDLDGDGDKDVLSASNYDDKIAWYENLGPTLPGPQILLSEDFDDGNYTGWSLVDQGTLAGPMAWSAASGTMVQSSNVHSSLLVDPVAKLGTYAYWQAGIGWTDYTAVVTIKSTDNDAIGIMFRYQDEDNYYRFIWDKERNSRQLVKCEDGVFSILAEDSVPYVTGKEYQVKIAVQDTSLQVSIDGSLVFSATDGSFSTGSIALYSWGNSSSYFDDILVEGLSAANQAPVISSVTASPPTIPDDQSSQLQVTASDPDVGPNPSLTYYWIVPSGQGIILDDLDFIANPTYIPPDVSSTQTFTLTVEVSDGAATTSQTVDITITDAGGGPQILLSDDFTDGNYNGWTLVDQGTMGGSMAWSAASGVMVQSSNVHSSMSVDPVAKLGTYAYWQAGTGWTDYTAVVTIKSTDNDAIGIMFRYQDESNYYRFIWDKERNSRQLVKCEDGVFSILAEDSVPYVTGKEYQVKIAVQDTSLQVSIDGSLVFSATDGSFLTGSIALYSWGNSSSYFDDILVEGLSAANQTPVISSVTASPPTIPDDQSSQLQVVASDPDNGPNTPLTYNWIVSSGQGSLDFSNIANPVYTPPDVSGTQIFTLTVEVSDGAAITSETVDITVTDAGAGPQILLSDDFNDGNCDGWTLVDQGTLAGPMAWSAASGIMVQSSNVHSSISVDPVAKLGTYAYWQAGTGWTDYTAAVTIKSTDNDAIGVMFRYQDENNYYRFIWDKERNSRQLVKCDDGVFSILDEDSVPYVTGKEYQVKISAQGSSLYVSIDGALVFSETDSSFSTGSIALYSWGNSSSYFDDIVVEGLFGTNQAPVANAGVDQITLDVDDDNIEQITLDGSGSTDSDGTIQNYLWTEGATILYNGPNPTAQVDLDASVHTITLTVTDDDGATDFDTVVIIIHDDSSVSISGYKFEDINDNGIDDSEPRLANWTIGLYLDDGDGIFNESTPTATTLTSSGGDYLFLNVDIGDYWVREIHQTGWIQTTVDPSLITIQSGDHISEVDDPGLAFGNFEFGSIIYVDDNASGDPGPGDPNVSDPLEDGTNAHPFDSIQEAIDVAIDGDIVIVAEGIYYENIRLDAENIRLTSTTPENPMATIIHGSAGSSVVEFTNGDNSRMIGFGITSSSTTRGITCSNSSPLIEKCEIFENTAYQGAGMYFGGSSRASVVNCVVRNNSDPSTSGGGGGASLRDYADIEFLNCVFYGNSTGDEGGALNSSGNAHSTWTNCTVTGNSASWGPGLSSESHLSITVINSIVAGNNGIGYQIWAGWDEIDYEDVSVWYSNIEGAYPGWPGATQGNIDVDPQFVDTSSNNYHLLQSSLCIDSGDPNSDYSLEPQPNGSRINMGAYGNTPEATTSSQLVYFADPNLKAAVEAQLGMSDPTETDMLGLTALNTEHMGITDLTGLEHAVNLTSLSLYNNQVSNINPLSGLMNLANLNLELNPINDISALVGLTNLVTLYINQNPVSDISVLAGLTNLTVLRLYENQISDISALAGLTNLNELRLFGNQISDISALSGLTNLTFLSLGNNQVSDISVLAGLTNLTGLHLYDNQISDISALSALTNITELHIASNQISDISALAGLTNLEWLELDNNQISDISPISGLTNFTHLDLTVNPLNGDAYNTYIPQILANNPGMTLLYDPPSTVLLSEDFNDGNYDGWSLVDQGTLAGPMAWSAASGTMVQSSNVHSSLLVDPVAKLGTYAYWQAGMGWTDYTAVVTIKSTDNDAIGIMFRYQDEDNYYRFIWDKERNSRQLVKCEDGVFSVLVEDSVPYVTGKEYQVKIAVQGNSLQVSIDGGLVFSATDGSFSTGSIALYSWGNSSSYFDNILVEGSNTTPPPCQLIPIPDRKDHVFDPVYQILYITTQSGTVERYDITTKEFLSPWAIGGTLGGIDVTPNGETVLVSDRSYDTTTNVGYIHRVDALSGIVTTLEFPLDGGQETGSWDVVAMNNGKAFFTTDFLGSGWVPLHELDLATNTIVDRPSSTFSGFNEVGQRTWLYRNANHSVMLGLESNSSAGPVFSYFADTDSFIAGAELGFYPGQTPRSIFHNNGSGSISRDGQWLAIEIERPHVPNEVWILDLALSNIATKLSGIEGGVIFDPYQDLLYGLDTVNDEIIVFDTNSWSEIERIDVCEDLLATQAFDEGVLSFDPLNSTVYVSVSGGILSIKIEFTVSTEDFNDGNYDGWTLIDQGTLAGPMAWSAASGVMVQSSNVHSSISVDPIAKLGTYAYWQTGIGWTDYTAKVTIKSDDNDAIGIMFRYQDENNYYRFIWDQERNSRQLVKCEGGVFSILAEDSVPYVTGKEYQVKISVQGNLLQVSIDGSPVFSVTDSTFSSGTIALYSWGNTGSYFDDIFVDGLP